MTWTIGVGVGGADRYHTKALEACQFLASVVAGVQGEPGFPEALAVARVQEAAILSWDSEPWEPVAYEE